MCACAFLPSGRGDLCGWIYRPSSGPRKVEIQAQFKSSEGGNTGRVQVLGRWKYKSNSRAKVEIQGGLRSSGGGNTSRVQGLGRWGLSWVKSNAKQYGTFDEVVGGVVLAECASSAVWRRNTRRPLSGRFVVGCGNNTDTKSCYT